MPLFVIGKGVAGVWTSALCILELEALEPLAAVAGTLLQFARHDYHAPHQPLGVFGRDCPVGRLRVHVAKEFFAQHIFADDTPGPSCVHVFDFHWVTDTFDTVEIDRTGDMIELTAREPRVRKKAEEMDFAAAFQKPSVGPHSQAEQSEEFDEELLEALNEELFGDPEVDPAIPEELQVDVDLEVPAALAGAEPQLDIDRSSDDGEASDTSSSSSSSSIHDVDAAIAAGVTAWTWGRGKLFRFRKERNGWRAFCTHPHHNVDGTPPCSKARQISLHDNSNEKTLQVLIWRPERVSSVIVIVFTTGAGILIIL